MDIVIFSLKLLILYVDDNALGRPTKKRTPTCFFAIFGIDDVIIWGEPFLKTPQNLKLSGPLDRKLKTEIRI